MTRQIASPRHSALDPALERVLTRHAALVDAATPNDDLISDHQRARIRRLMIALFRVAANRRASIMEAWLDVAKWMVDFLKALAARNITLIDEETATFGQKS